MNPILPCYSNSEQNLETSENPSKQLIILTLKVSLVFLGCLLIGGGIASYFYWSGYPPLIAFAGSGAALIASVILYQCIACLHSFHQENKTRTSIRERNEVIYEEMFNRRNETSTKKSLEEKHSSSSSSQGSEKGNRVANEALHTESTDSIARSRPRVGLPVRGDNKTKWDNFEVKWLGAFEGNPFLMQAELPPGWKVHEKPVGNFDNEAFVILDADGVPKADVWIKIASYDQKARVTVLSEEEGLKMKEQFAPKPDQEEFESLLSCYNATVRTVFGCGARGQNDIDEAYANLKQFVTTHPEFDSKLPRKHQCHDDGVEGMAGTMMTMTSFNNLYM